MTIFWQDVRFSARMLKKAPGFTLVAVCTLALGIGANTAIFSVINAVLLRPLPFKEPDRLVAVWSTDLRNPFSELPVSSLDMADWARQSQSIESFGSWFTIDLTLTGGGEPTRVKGKGVDGDLFSLLGIPPMLGRVFRTGDNYVVLLSYRLWQSRFNADRDVVGQTITLNGMGYTIAGVMPQEFHFPIEAEPGDLWVTWDYAKLGGPMYARDARLSEVIGRLRSGVTAGQAQTEMDAIAAALRQQYPRTNKDIGVRLMPADEHLVGRHRQALFVLFGAVGCVLLIACVNVANLLLVRAAGRRREMALRAALGASRGRTVRQLLTESLILALAGGIVGGLLAMWGVDLLLALNPSYLPGAEKVGIDGRVLSFTLLASLLTGALFGLVPALHTSKIDLTTALKDDERTASEVAGGKRLRSLLVVAEIALSFILLAGAALLINSYWRLLRVDPGFDPRNVLTFRVSLPYEKYDLAQASEFFRRLQPSLQNIPGVRAASIAFPLPFNGETDFENMDANLDTRLDIEGRPLDRGERPRVDGTTVQPDYFRAMGIGMIAGRDFKERDDAKAPPVAIINQTLARRYFTNENPIGKRLRLDSVVTRNRQQPMREIVGVVDDVKNRGLNVDARPEVYLPFAQDPFQEMFVVLKTEGDPTSFVGAARAAVLSLDQEQPIFNIKTFEQRLGLSVGQQRFNTLLLALFSSLALLLAAIGLYGVLSFTVAQRTHEIGIRMALGAQVSDVLNLVVGQGIKLVMTGVVCGLLGAFALTRLLKGLLFGVSPTDPLTFAEIALLVASVTLAACYLPARRAAEVDPIVALRKE